MGREMLEEMLWQARGERRRDGREEDDREKSKIDRYRGEDREQVRSNCTGHFKDGDRAGYGSGHRWSSSCSCRHGVAEFLRGVWCPIHGGSVEYRHAKLAQDDSGEYGR